MKSLKEIVHRLTFLQKINLSAEAYKHYERRVSCSELDAQKPICFITL